MPLHLADFPLHQSRRADGLAAIAAAVAAEAGMSAIALRDRTRRHAISHTRHEAILRQIEAGFPKADIGRWWSYDQTTIRHACQSARANRANGRLREVILCAPGAKHE